LVGLDVTDSLEIERVAERVVASGGVDVVFNNAGYGLAGALEGLKDEQILRMISTNLLGPIRTTKAFLPHFREKGAGLFINTTSVGGLSRFLLTPSITRPNGRSKAGAKVWLSS
jgi:NAD(P)-dependent dehydrogenase (short-subunit alcohol dehydrogenase family)